MSGPGSKANLGRERNGPGGNPGASKGTLHPRNRHQGRYDFEKLKKAHPELSKFVAKNKYGDDSIDFADPEAVKALNRALLQDFYDIQIWDIPKNYLCPPIPGRADYIHNLADVIFAEKNNDGGSNAPNENALKTEVGILDIGVGANCIYPIIGHHDYGWSFVGADLNPESLKNAAWIIQENKLENAIELRLQKNRKNIFKGVIGPTDRFDATMCNPPFHASLEEAQKGTERKWNNLGKVHEKQKVNFGGQGAELWCAGGELAFIRTMIEESALFSKQVKWFSTLVSKEDSLPAIKQALKTVQVKEFKTLEMSQGQKKSRIVAWSF